MVYQKTKEPEQKKNAPVDRIKVGAIEVSTWENISDKGSFFTLTMQRSYKKGDEWGTTSSLKVDDVPKAILALQKAYEALVIKTREEAD